MHKRKSAGARLLASLIGISPLPGPPVAAYGSIIIPDAFHRLIRSTRIFRKSLRIARLLTFFYCPYRQEDLRVPFSGWATAPLRNVPAECLFSYQCSVGGFCPSHFPLLTFLTKIRKNFLKIFSRLILGIKKRLSSLLTE